MKKNLLLSLLLVLTLSCGRQLPVLENIDLHKWAEDRNACLGLRSTMIKALEDQKRKLLGLTEQQIVELLSRPDQNELYKRNQKFYYYFLLPSKICSGEISKQPLQLVVRFNAMGIAKEINLE